LNYHIDDERIITETPGCAKEKILWNAIVEFTKRQKPSIWRNHDSFFSDEVSEEQRVNSTTWLARHV